MGFLEKKIKNQNKITSNKDKNVSKVLPLEFLYLIAPVIVL